jgi:tetratricopeptide (TPR) repeat protein
MEQAVYVELTTDRYIDALSEFELDPRRVTSERAAAFFMTRPDEVRIGVTDALDSWLSMLCQPSSNEPGHRDWVREVLARIDHNPLRTSIRAMASAADQDALRLVADDQSLLDQSPAFIWLVAAQLDNPDDTIRLLRQARARHPESLLLNHQLGEQLVHNRRGLEATDAYIAALAIKPDAPTNVRAAFLLADHDRYDESIAMFRNAIRIDPECGEAYARLAEILTWLNRAPEAILVTDEALANLPRDHEDAWQFHVARGEACEQLQEREAALLAYRLALNLDSMPTSDRTDILDRVSRLETPHSE